MLEVENAELSAAYRAVEALLRIAASDAMSFRIGVVDEKRWEGFVTRLDAPCAVGGRDADKLELARCPATVAVAVLRRVLEIGRTSLFAHRCRSLDVEDPALDPGVPNAVVYLQKYAEPLADADLDEPTLPSAPLALSGVRSRVHPAKLA